MLLFWSMHTYLWQDRRNIRCMSPRFRTNQIYNDTLRMITGSFTKASPAFRVTCFLYCASREAPELLCKYQRHGVVTTRFDSIFIGLPICFTWHSLFDAAPHGFCITYLRGVAFDSLPYTSVDF